MNDSMFDNMWCEWYMSYWVKPRVEHRVWVCKCKIQKPHKTSIGAKQFII